MHQLRDAMSSAVLLYQMCLLFCCQRKLLIVHAHPSDICSLGMLDRSYQCMRGRERKGVHEAIDRCIKALAGEKRCEACVVLAARMGEKSYFGSCVWRL
ncbi:uncharacterized protein EDB91DRAFT_1173940 [Suillus paluster]|uniref:uncharacterized protein n=1 Tax=Suillus paluster TaxID=48578 RepID=UPI001B88361C|nr:uncharacterized protein EDB91DRAFT_1173940 [Suillus paluster]KAG1722937.1 hypothetical protein EDB91DRAFT_1173940 [Suillus paluster]